MVLERDLDETVDQTDVAQVVDHVLTIGLDSARSGEVDLRGMDPWEAVGVVVVEDL